MKKQNYLLITLALTLLLGACSAEGDPAPEATVPTTAETTLPETLPPETEPEETEQTIPLPEPAAASDNWYAVNQTVWALAETPVYADPVEDDIPVGILPPGGSVLRLRMGDSGWSEVLYNGSIVFIPSDCLTDQEDQLQTVIISQDFGTLQESTGEAREIVKAITGVNVRSGPGTEYERIGLLFAGETIQRLQNGSDGWSQVLYEGSPAYVKSEYLETCTVTGPDPASYLGRWSIPEAGVDVACYRSTDQTVVDALDSAAVFRMSRHTVIADHKDQAFAALKRCKVGMTAYMDSPEGRTTYRCVEIIQGHNTGTDLVDAGYTTIRGLHPEALVNYTCMENWQNVVLVFFEEVQTDPTEP